MQTTFTQAKTDKVFSRLREAGRRYDQDYPGAATQRQPVHVVYGGAHLFKSGTIEKIGMIARRYLADYGPDAREFAKALGVRKGGSASEAAARLTHRVYDRVVEKLAREPVEDFRIDFEDGYGHRPAEEEDAHAKGCAQAVAREMEAGTLPPFFGIRIKSLRDECDTRQGRTLDLFVTTLARATRGRLPDNFVVTLPKVTMTQEVAALVDLLEILEADAGVAPGSLKLEIMVETPQSLVDSQGRGSLPLLIAAAKGRCVAAHFGAYDFTAGIDIIAAYQQMGHPACNFARHMMQVSLAGTGVRLSDGATTRLPLEPHRTPTDGASLSDGQMAENRRAVHRAWRESYATIRHSLENGFYQGWDLHPAQLPARYAALYTFFLEEQAAVARRLKVFVDKAARATAQGGQFDDAATGQGMLNFFLRGINCRAFNKDAAAKAGLSVEEIRTRSFASIVANRCR